MFKLFNFNSWSALDRASVKKSDIFLSQFTLLAIIGATISAFHDAFYESITTVIIDLSIVVVFLATYLVNERGHHLKAKLAFVFLSPTSMFIYAALLPKESGVYFIFFPIIMIIFLLFDRNEKIYQLSATCYALCLLFILEATDYQPFGIPPLLIDVASSTSYIINLVIALFVIVFSLFSIENLNHQIESKRQEALITLNERNIELKEINEELDQFVYSASHDLKAPLLSILGLVNIAKYDIEDELTLEYFQKIEKRILKLNGFIKEVLTISRNARTEIEKEEVYIKPVIEELIEQNSYIDGADQVSFNLDLKIPNTVTIDKYRFEIILNNIISNAIKYQDKCNTKQLVEIIGRKELGRLNITVKDNGVGISETDSHKVFEMFYRANERSEGSGLGLYIVQTALKKLNGTIKINSMLGQGTEVVLSIPVN